MPMATMPPQHDGSAGAVAADVAGVEGEEAAMEAEAIDELQRGLGEEEGLAGGDGMGDFFKTVAAVTRAEEALVNAHREAVEEDDQLLAQEKMLLEDLQQPDGSSVDDYAAQLEGIISTKIERYMQLQKRLASLKESLAHEETLSARVQKLPMY